jgi:hypothetical protein
LRRAAVARGDYLGQGRADMQFAAKEISRFTSKPEEQDWRSAKRLVRHVQDNKGIVIEHNFQKPPEKVVAWSDANIAGPKRARRSNSGGVVMFGNHCVKIRSQAQETITSSSRESEFYGVVKAAAMGLGVKGLMEDLGVGMEAQVSTDSNAARRIASRRGAWRVRHIEVRVLRVQDGWRKESSRS